MADLPLTSYLSLTGGVRIERTELSIVNFPEENATWFAPGDSSPSTLDPGEADVDFRREDTLPSIAFAFTPIDEVTLRGSYSRTVARQTFKELTPIIQQEFLGGPVFIGNPDLDMSSLENYDLRFDYRPSEATLFSVSYFKKKIEDPIEFVQRVTTLSFTTPVNYPEGDLKGFEIEFRQNLGQLWEGLDGFSVGANATFIDSEVILPAEEAALFEDPAIEAPMPTRDMTNAPEYLYNLYLTYDLPATGTSIGLFYTVRGDTLVAGATAADENLVPNIYEKEFDTLNFSISQKIGDYFKLQFKAKNLTNPRFEEVYRSPGIESDVLKSSFTKGIDYSISLSAEFTF
jgi:TonB-dependent receptor